MKVEIWSDVVCPWCYVGKRRFETALARFAHSDQVEVVWRSFELDPNAPQTPHKGTVDLLSKKYGVSMEQARAMNDRVTSLAAAEGVEFRLDEAQHGNTFDAHRLIHLADAHGLQEEAKERLLRAYFTEGLAISDPETLATIGIELGLPEDEVRTVLDGDAYADAVRADERRASAFGIRGVPFFAIDEQYGVSGAQTPEALLGALEQAWAARHPLTPLADAEDGDGFCDDGGCAVTPAERGE